MDNPKHYEENYFEDVYHFYLEDNKSDYLLKLSAFYMYNYFGVNKIELRGKRVLDYGCGLGYMTSSINADCYDISDFCREKIKQQYGNNRIVYDTPEQIPIGLYDVILCNHSFEHYLNPVEALAYFKTRLTPNGLLALVLPIDNATKEPCFTQDIHKHFYGWNFQNLSNLLIEVGYEIVQQQFVYAPTGLKHLKNLELIRKLGKWRNLFKSQLTIAQAKI